MQNLKHLSLNFTRCIKLTDETIQHLVLLDHQQIKALGTFSLNLSAYLFHNSFLFQLPHLDAHKLLMRDFIHLLNLLPPEMQLSPIWILDLRCNSSFSNHQSQLLQIDAKKFLGKDLVL